MRHESVAQLARLRSLLESIEDPCWLLDHDGRPVVRNAAARNELTLPFFILDFVAGRPCDLPRGCRIRHISIDGVGRILAMARSRRDDSSADFADLGMSEPHVEVAEHIVRGFSDVEIALLIGRPVGMVHAFIIHVHRQLGVSTRTELVAFMRRARDSVIPAPLDRSGTTVNARGQGWRSAPMEREPVRLARLR